MIRTVHRVLQDTGIPSIRIPPLAVLSMEDIASLSEIEVAVNIAAYSFLVHHNLNQLPAGYKAYNKALFSAVERINGQDADNCMVALYIAIHETYIDEQGGDAHLRCLSWFMDRSDEVCKFIITVCDNLKVNELKYSWGD